jgi:hypothetical protein
MAADPIWTTLTEEQQQWHRARWASAREERDADPTALGRYVSVLRDLYLRRSHGETANSEAVDRPDRQTAA